MSTRRPMGLTARAWDQAGESANAVARTGRVAQRRFDAAIVDRLTSDWSATNVAIDFELRSDLNRLRARARDLSKNNEYAKKFLRMVRNNVVGPSGFKLQCKAADPAGTDDRVANAAIEKAFDKWSRARNCDIAGKRTFVDMCRLLVTGLARDGEFMVRKIRGAGAGPFGFQLQLLDMDRLDTLYNVPGTQSSNAIIMGVEMTPFRKPVAYHLWNAPQYPGDFTRYRERVPAADIIHAFIPEEAEQTRGFTWMCSAMRRSNDLNAYREAAVIAARIGASKMGFFQSPDGEPPSASPAGEAGSDEDEMFTEVAAGQFDTLPIGYEFKEFDPTYPHDQFEAFCKSTLRGIASGWGVSYNGLANDLENVSFSSIRSGTLEERDEWMVIQDFLISSLCVEVFEEWLPMSLLSGAIVLPNGSRLPAAKLDKFSEHMWRGRRWQWVDPLKDLQASTLAIANRLASPQTIAAQSGVDVEDVIADIAKYNALCAEAGIAPVAAPPAPLGQVPNDTPPPSE